MIHDVGHLLLSEKINYKKKKIHTPLSARKERASCMPHALHDQLAMQSPVNRLNGYSFLTALGFASGVRYR